MTLFFGVAPALGPVVGGVLFVQWGVVVDSGFLAVVGLGLWLSCLAWLPETLPPERRQCCTSRRCFVVIVTWRATRASWCGCWSACCLQRLFPVRASSPEWLGTHLALAPTQFYVYFMLSIACVMGGAWVCGRLAGRVRGRRQIRWGFTVMATMMAVNVAANFLWSADVRGLVAGDVVCLRLVDDDAAGHRDAARSAPQRRGMVSSLQAGIGAAVTPRSRAWCRWR